MKKALLVSMIILVGTSSLVGMELPTPHQKKYFEHQREMQYVSRDLFVLGIEFQEDPQNQDLKNKLSELQSRYEKLEKEQNQWRLDEAQEENKKQSKTKDNNQDSLPFFDNLTTAQKLLAGFGVVSAIALSIELIGWANTSKAKKDIDALEALMANDKLDEKTFDAAAKEFTCVSKKHQEQLRARLKNSNDFKNYAKVIVILDLKRIHNEIGYATRLKDGMSYRANQLKAFGKAVADQIGSWFGKTKSM